MNRNLLIVLSALLPLAAYSAPVVYTQGDLIMGFKTTGNGAGQYYTVNLGSAAKFRDATAPVTLSLGNLAADLGALYGPDWADSADITWSIAGTPSNTAAFNGDPEDTIYASRMEDTAGVPAAAWKISARPNRGTTATQLENMQDTFKTYQATANSPSGVIQSDSDATAATIYAAYLRGGRSSIASLDFGAFYPIEGDLKHTLSLFRLPDQNPGSYEGYFTLSSGGQVTFTPSSTTPVQSPYTTWAQTNVGGQGPTQDFDGDGISNLLEYFMGTAPNAATPNIVPSGGSITWPRSTTAQVPAFRVEASTDLVSWTDVTSGATVSTSQIVYPLPTGASKTFVRLSVDAPQN